MNKLLSVIVGAVLVPVVTFSGVGATTAVGQIEGGNIYKAKNVTKGGVFEDPTNATCNDLVKLRVEIHNPGPVALQNVKVAATVPTATATTHSSQVTVSASNANPASTSDTAGIKLDKAGKLSYVAGSAEYFDPTGSRLGSISDSIVAGGAIVPNGVGVSFDQRRYVQFQVKVVCEVTPTVPEVPVTPVTPTKVTPAVIAVTGPASTVATMFGLSALAAGIGYFVQRHRNILG
jgi:uncharacterized repeat protein (TIGR01451 family)